MIDAPTTIKTLLAAQWNAANTDGITPNIDIVLDAGAPQAMVQDSIFTYSINYTTEPNGIGPANKSTEEPVSVDIRSRGSRVHMIKVVNEVERILDNNMINPAAGYDKLTPLRSKDLSDRSKKLGRFIFDCRLSQLTTSR